MKRSETFNKVVSAIGNVQQDMAVLEKDSTADAGKYTYKYTGMPTIWAELKPLLKKHGLTVLQTTSAINVTSMGDFITTFVQHDESGEWVEDTMRLVIPRDDPQGMGMAITYAERYAIKTMFKIVTGDDDAASSRLADGEQKKDWVRAYTVMVKKNNPEHEPTHNEFISFMTDVYGKHPTKVLAKESQQVLDTINAFDSSK